ncbi:hypothetical protein Ciccas_000502 [Cichlidogyrus casuarinus]|uniref:Uncharacterized protein n=1 Tax=Cichlidogyrus casuarinus TaxID=1844966 RepID=A0ABD2QN46_9PLAT
MGQASGKFTVPHANVTKAPIAENGKEHHNGDVMNGKADNADIPHITEPEVTETEKAKEEGKEETKKETVELDETTENMHHKHHGDTLLKKAKKRAASWKSKLKHTPTKTTSGDSLTATDENNNLDVEEQKTESSEPTNEESPIEQKPDQKQKKAKRSISSLMKRASSLTSKKNKPDKNNNVEIASKKGDEAPVVQVSEEEIKTEEIPMPEEPAQKDVTQNDPPQQTLFLESFRKKSGLNAEAAAQNLVNQVFEAINCHADEPKVESPTEENKTAGLEEAMAKLKVDEVINEEEAVETEQS